MTVRADKEMESIINCLLSCSALNDASEADTQTDTQTEEGALQYLLELVQDIDNANGEHPSIYTKDTEQPFSAHFVHCEALKIMICALGWSEIDLF